MCIKLSSLCQRFVVVVWSSVWLWVGLSHGSKAVILRWVSRWWAGLGWVEFGPTDNSGTIISIIIITHNNLKHYNIWSLCTKERPVTTEQRLPGSSVRTKFKIFSILVGDATVWTSLECTTKSTKGQWLRSLVTSEIRPINAWTIEITMSVV